LIVYGFGGFSISIGEDGNRSPILHWGILVQVEHDFRDELAIKFLYLLELHFHKPDKLVWGIGTEDTIKAEGAFFDFCRRELIALCGFGWQSYQLKQETGIGLEQLIEDGIGAHCLCLRGKVRATYHTISKNHNSQRNKNPSLANYYPYPPD